MKILYGLAVALSLLIATTVQAAPSGKSMIFFLNELQPEEQQPFLAGAIEMLGGLGLLQCPGRIALTDVKNALISRQKTGKSSPGDRFVAEVLAAHYALGCTLDKRVLDSLDPALRKKLPQ